MTRFYDQRIWRDNVRPAQLARQPLCEHCKARGRIVLAIEVDHRVPISAGGSALDADNLQSLCVSCHSRKTAADNGGHVTIGFDVDGNPLDPEHHWNK